LPHLLCSLRLEIGGRGGLGVARTRQPRRKRDGEILVHVEMRSICAGVAALAMGFGAGLWGTLWVGQANAGLETLPARIPISESAEPNSFRRPLGSQMPDSSGVRVASLGTGVGFDSVVEESAPPPSARSHISFAERFFAALDVHSTSADVSPGSALAKTTKTERANSLAVPATDAGGQAIPPAAGRSAPKLASLASTPVVSTAKKRIRLADASKDLSSLPSADSRTAVYDILAHTVYLPNGKRLEAHSGLGSHLDDPRYVNVKRQGPTPPNVYDLTLREELFHGVRAIRLIPVDDGKMFGRDGMLAHTYMLGPNGQSNGCVSFSDYPAFLNAYLKGEIDRLVVVEHLANAPGAEAASGWFPEAIKNLFRRS
jgi:hypothetical protein